MKEFNLAEKGLTTQAPKAYSIYGADFMEGKPDMPSTNPKPTHPERTEASSRDSTKFVSEGSQEVARGAWKKANEGRVVDVNEKRTQEMLVERGRGPVSGGQESEDISQEEARRRLEEAARRGQQQRRGEPTQPTAGAGGTGQGGGGEKPPAKSDVANGDQNGDSGERNENPREVLQKEFVGRMRNLYRIVKDNPIFREDHPDFSKIKELSDFMENIPADEAYMPILTYIAKGKIPGISEDGTRIEGLANISDDARKVLFEWMVEKVIGIPDENPARPYQSFFTSLSKQNILSEIGDLSRTSFDAEFNSYIASLMGIRPEMHEFERSLSQGEAYKEFFQRELRAHALDFVTNELAGMREVRKIYEDVAPNKVRDRKDWFNAQDIKEVDDRVRKIVIEMQANGEIEKDGRKLTKWEIERALKIERTMFAGLQRRAIYAGLGNIPTGTSERDSSTVDEYIMRTNLGPVKLINFRFHSDKNSGARAYMERIIKDSLELESNTYGVKDPKTGKKPSKFLPLFGVDQRTNVVNSFGITDLQSHSWRSTIQYLGNIHIAQGRTLMEYLDEISKKTTKNDKEDLDPVLGRADPDIDKFSKAVEETILGQRLYYSVLARFGALNTEMKTKIWQKRAILNPSSIVSLMPETMFEGSGEDAKLWDGLFDRLVRAESQRVNEDTRMEDEYQKLLTEKALLRKEGHSDIQVNEKITEMQKKLATGQAEEALKFKLLPAESLLDKIAVGQQLSEKEHGIIAGLIGDYGESDLKKSLQNLLSKNKTGKSLTDDDKRGLEALKYDKYQIAKYFKDVSKGENPEKTAKEEALIRQMINKGVSKNAELLANANLPFTFCINDAPQIAWVKKGEGTAGSSDPDLFRLMLSDQKSLGEGFGALVGLIESPEQITTKPFVEFVDKVGSVQGRTHAQERMEPFLTSIIEMVATKTKIENVPLSETVHRLLRKPTSEMEEFFRSSFISWDAKTRKDFLTSLAQAKAISDNVKSAGEKLTQLDRLKKRSKSSELYVFLSMLRTMIYLLGPEVAYEFFKAILPPEAAKSLQLK